VPIVAIAKAFATIVFLTAWHGPRFFSAAIERQA